MMATVLMRKAEAGMEDVGDDGNSVDEEGFWELGDVHTIAGKGLESMAHVAEGNEGDAERQRDEAEAMAAMYGSDFVLISPREWLFRYDIATGVVGEMCLRLPLDYPSRSPPALTLDIVNCPVKTEKANFRRSFEPGTEVAFAWAERFRELCQVSAAEQQECVERKHAERARQYERTWAAQDAQTCVPQRRLARHWRRTPWTLPSDKALALPSRAEVVEENRRRQKEVEAREKLAKDIDSSWKVSVTNRRCQNPLRPRIF